MQQQASHTYKENYSFIIHESTIRMSSLLTAEQLGRLYQHIHSYVSGDPTPCEETDVAVNIIFNEWRIRYEADKEAYEHTRQQRSKAGRKGMEKRWKKQQETTSDNETITKITDSEYDSDIDSVFSEENEKQKETSPKGEAKKKISLAPPLEQRKEAFLQSILPHTDRYGSDMLNDFFQYWTELDRRRQRMKFETQRHWETGKRLSAWSRKSFCHNST